MNQIREVERINQEELKRGIAGTAGSWHAKYANSAWVFAGNLDYELTEGDVIAVLSEYGEIEDFHLVRDEETGKSKGFCFCKYEDARSCVLAVDNLCGVAITAGRSLRVDHVENYRLPKSLQDKEEELQKRLLENQGLEGHAYDGVELENQFSLLQGQDLFATNPRPNSLKLDEVDDEKKQRKVKKRKHKEEKKEAKEIRKRKRAQIRQEREERRRQDRAKNITHDDDDSREDSHHKRKKHKKSKRDDKKKRSKSEKHSRSH